MLKITANVFNKTTHNKRKGKNNEILVKPTAKEVNISQANIQFEFGRLNLFLRLLILKGLSTLRTLATLGLASCLRGRGIIFAGLSSSIFFIIPFFYSFMHWGISDSIIQILSFLSYNACSFAFGIMGLPSAP